MKLTDEMVEKTANDETLCDFVMGEFGYTLSFDTVQAVLTAYHKILSSTEPDEALVEQVGDAIDSTFASSRGDPHEMSRAAIRAIFGGE